MANLLDRPIGDDRMVVEVSRNPMSHSMRLRWYSLRYRWRGGGISINEAYLNRAGMDFHYLMREIHRLLLGHVDGFERVRLPPPRIEESLRAMEPFFDEAIHRLFTEVEYRGRRDYFDQEIFLQPYIRPQQDEKAIKKARDLLRSQLNKKQLADFDKSETFQVVGKDKKTYTISKARSFNVVGPDGVKYCGQTVDTPIEDQMLAQKLLLENDPEKFFKNCNRTGGTPSIARVRDWML